MFPITNLLQRVVNEALVDVQSVLLQRGEVAFLEDLVAEAQVREQAECLQSRELVAVLALQLASYTAFPVNEQLPGS